MVENHRREKSQSLARRGWAKIKPAMAKWKEERKEERGMLLKIPKEKTPPS